MSAQRLRQAALGAGVLLVLAYAAWQCLEPHGPAEFAYAPFTPGSLPYSAMRGFTYEQLWGHVRRVLLLGPGLVLLAAGLSQRARLAEPRHLRRFTLWLCGASLLVTALVMLLVLRGRAITDDELAYAMQAGFFADGRLTGPDLGLDPHDVFNVMTPRGYSVQYLPGEPLVQVLGVVLGVPALLHLPIVGLTFVAWYRSLLLTAGERIAALGTCALACSPMLMLTSATGLSHATSLLCVVVMGLGLALARGERGLAGALLFGLALGFGLLTRLQAAAPAGAVLGLALAVTLLRRRAWLGLMALLLGSLAAVAAVLGYDQLQSGSPFKLPWFMLCDPARIGFGQVWQLDSYEHTPWAALQNLAVVAVRLNAWWLGLPLSLAVVPLYFRFKRRVPGSAAWLGVGVAVLVFELFYYSTGVSDTGAIYHYELLLPGALLAAGVADALLTRYPSWAPLALALGLVLGSGSFTLEQTLRLGRLVETIHHDSDAALAKLEGRALLIHERLESEALPHGWVFSSFPRRYRRPSDRVVTLPRISRDLRARAERVYPGRSCYYFRYLPGTRSPQLERCEEVEALLERSSVTPPAGSPPPVWEKPTAYLRAGYDPFPEIARRKLRDKDGKRLTLCCELRDLEALGEPVPAAALARCE